MLPTAVHMNFGRMTDCIPEGRGSLVRSESLCGRALPGSTCWVGVMLERGWGQKGLEGAGSRAACPPRRNDPRGKGVTSLPRCDAPRALHFVPTATAFRAPPQRLCPPSLGVPPPLRALVHALANTLAIVLHPQDVPRPSRGDP